MNTFRQSKNIAVFALTMLLIAIAAIVYLILLFNAVTNNTMKTVDEVAGHDVQSIEGTLDVQYEKLSAITKRIETLHINNMSELQKKLKIEADSSEMYDSLYIMDDKGTLYSSSSAFYTTNEHSYYEMFLHGKDQFVKLYDESNGVFETTRESLIFGVKIPETTLGGHKIVAILGRSNPAVLRDQLLMETFKGQGKASVINADGYYIVTDIPLSDFTNRTNFFSLLNTYTIQNGLTIEDIKRKVFNGESFTIRCTTTEGVELVESFWPIKGTSWSFIISVPTSFFQEQFLPFIVMTIGMLIAVILAIIIMMALISHYLRRSLLADAESKARAEFLSNMSHEIRTPLNGIIGLNHLMQESIDNPSALKTYMIKSDKAANYLLSLVNDILDMSKLQAGKVELDEKPFDLKETLTNIYDIQKETIETKGIIYQETIDLPQPYVYGDEVRISQVIVNILSNAAKFTPSGGKISLSVYQEAITSEDKVKTIFIISDTGCGMPPEFQKHIFEMFTQERTFNESSQKGTGLGMSISSLLVNQMGGELSVESKLGAGSTFKVELTLRTAVEPISKKSEARVISSDAAIIPASILVAEDNELNADIVSTILRNKGYDVTVVSNGEEAVRTFEQSELGKYPIILMDIQMPVMNGYDASMAIRNLHREDAMAVSIVACTASTLIEDRDRAIASGMNDFLAKPIQVKKMVYKIDEILKEKQCG